MEHRKNRTKNFTGARASLPANHCGGHRDPPSRLITFSKRYAMQKNGMKCNFSVSIGTEYKTKLDANFENSVRVFFRPKLETSTIHFQIGTFRSLSSAFHGGTKIWTKE